MARKLSDNTTKDSPYKYAAWAAGAIGGGAALAMTSAATPAGLAAAALAGVFVGGVAVPAACLGVAVAALSVYDLKKGSWVRKGEIAAFSAMTIAVSARFLTKELFFRPAGRIARGIRKPGEIFRKKERPTQKAASLPPSPPETVAKIVLPVAGPAKDFEAAGKPKQQHPLRAPGPATDISVSPGLTD
jgi:hypothetical protein